MVSKTVVQHFFNDVATKDLTVAIGNAISQARDVEQRSAYLAHVALKLLDCTDVAQLIPASVRSSCMDAMVLQIAGLPHSEKAGLAFELAALIEPARALGERWTGSGKVSPVAFLATCINPTLILHEESQRTRENLRVAGLTIEMLISSPGNSGDAQTRDFRFELLGFGTDLTAKAAAGFWSRCPLVGMHNELRKTIKVLNAKADSVILTGEPGVGKSALVEGLAYKIVHGDEQIIPKSMNSWTIILIEASDIIKSAGVVGGLEREMKKLLDFFRTHPTVIPFFDEVHRLLDTGDDNLKAVATALKPPMANGSFRCIGATTNREYTQFIASDDAMRSRLRRIQVVEPTGPEAVSIIEDSADRLLEGRPAELGITFARNAIEAAVHVTTTYKRTERLPRKAINLLKIAASEKSYDLDIQTPGKVESIISNLDVARIFSDLEEIPLDALATDQTSYYQMLAERLNRRVIGQSKAVNAVTSWLALQSKGWCDPQRPRGRFVFTGPPGVGKTELAKTLAKELMRDPESLIVMDMGDYQDDNMAATKFMGSPAGYAGYRSTQTLYTRVMTRPYSVVLFDEFEKCSPVLSNPLLSVLDGFATDTSGNKVDFSQTIIIMTSNSLAMPPGADASTLADEALRSLLPRTGPIWTAPLLDRVDKICAFSRLDDGSLNSILAGLIERRSAIATQPLPTEIGSVAAKQAILTAAAAEDGTASARRLERAMLDWLRDFSAAGAAKPASSANAVATS